MAEFQKKYSDLKNHFGEENINIEYFGDSLKKVRVTHFPSEKIKLGENKNTQIENAIEALEELKAALVYDAEIDMQSNSELVNFLENPIDLQKFKFANINHVSTRVTNGKDYHFHPEIYDSIFYRYKFNINSIRRKNNNEIVVFKFGENKHKYDDETEILIDLKIFNKVSGLGNANLIGITKTELESKFGTDYIVLENRIIYSYKNKVLLLELKNSKVKSFRYIKLNTENSSQELLLQIIK